MSGDIWHRLQDTYGVEDGSDKVRLLGSEASAFIKMPLNESVNDFLFPSQ
jgi:hypothetical protein